MRILHILDHSIPRHSSYALRTLALLKQQRALGWHTIHLTGPRQGRLDSSSHKLDGWHFFRTVPNGAAWSRIPLLRHVAYVHAMARRLRQVVKLTRPDLLHVHPPALNALAALRVGRSLGVPVVCEIRPSWAEAAIARGASAEDSMRCRASRALETYLARHADAIVTASAGLRANLQVRGVPGQRITVIPAAIGIRHVDPDQPFDAGLARPPGMGDGPVIGFIGSFYAHEGLDLLLAAMPSMLRACPSLRLLLAGSGPHEEQLKERAEQLGVAAKVTFANRVANHYAQIDLLVYPRLQMPLTELLAPARPLQAMAHGRLVVASNIGAHRELIEHGKTGILFEPGSASGLADAVLSLLTEPGCWQPLGDAARAFVARERSWAACAARCAPLYTALLERKRTR